MPTYYCEICNFSTKIRTHLETHHNTKNTKIMKRNTVRKHQKVAQT